MDSSLFYKARMQQQQASFAALQEQNAMIIRNLHEHFQHGNMQIEEEETEADRMERISVMLKPTTFVSP